MSRCHHDLSTRREKGFLEERKCESPPRDHTRPSLRRFFMFRSSFTGKRTSQPHHNLMAEDFLRPAKGLENPKTADQPQVCAENMSSCGTSVLSSSMLHRVLRRVKQAKASQLLHSAKRDSLSESPVDIASGYCRLPAPPRKRERFLPDSNLSVKKCFTPALESEREPPHT